MPARPRGPTARDGQHPPPPGSQRRPTDHAHHVPEAGWSRVPRLSRARHRIREPAGGPRPPPRPVRGRAQAHARRANRAVQVAIHVCRTATARAGVSGLSDRLEGGSVAIIGLGGTGSYVLDLVSKTPVAAIHLFDDDLFLQHKAFRAPGAGAGEDITARRTKVDHFANVYSRTKPFRATALRAIPIVGNIANGIPWVRTLTTSIKISSNVVRKEALKMARTSIQRKDRIATILFFLFCAGSFAVFALAGRPTTGLLAGCSLTVVLTVGYLRWDIRDRSRLWTILASISAINATAIVAVGQGRIPIPVFTVVPIAIAETIGILFLLSIFERPDGAR